MTEIPTQLVAAGVPQQVVDRSPEAARVDLTGTGDLGAAILAGSRPSSRPRSQPLIPAIVQGIHEAFSIAIASTFWVGIVGRVIAAVAVPFLHEEPMRATFEIEEPAVVPEGSLRRADRPSTSAPS